MLPYPCPIGIPQFGIAPDEGGRNTRASRCHVDKRGEVPRILPDLLQQIGVYGRKGKHRVDLFLFDCLQDRNRSVVVEKHHRISQVDVEQDHGRTAHVKERMNGQKAEAGTQIGINAPQISVVASVGNHAALGNPGRSRGEQNQSEIFIRNGNGRGLGRRRIFKNRSESIGQLAACLDSDRKLDHSFDMRQRMGKFLVVK